MTHLTQKPTLLYTSHSLNPHLLGGFGLQVVGAEEEVEDGCTRGVVFFLFFSSFGLRVGLGLGGWEDGCAKEDVEDTWEWFWIWVATRDNEWG
ncbi:hypothetical protein D8674_013824 [Pyrus ussuriensis x Pyrus communis]|uniref:Uncharacterized protein n=1 Tax=Pyrus ussuriensis x Pyrus communis TaxID=2448454 RepID=A0A5N5GQT2_9ROSA|nr:hypothetical protein D8674_013824 [Pyrus ussuriensis x Pyrus communis]